MLTSSTINGATTNYSYSSYGIPTAWTENRALLWSNGTQLAAIGNATFTYDGEGQRLTKTVSGKTTGYTYEGTNLIRQKNADGSRLFFLYDANGLIGFDYIPASGSAQTYFYRFDGEGRITAVVDPAGDVVAQYAYDPWGVITAVTDADDNAVSGSHIGNLNPIRYKGYYYDAETGLYYLNSRYYDPEVCRFISADSVSYLGADSTPISYNLYAYCKNNPVNHSDPSGNFAWLPLIGAIVGGAAAGALVSTVSYVVSSALNSQNVVTAGIVNAVVTGAACGGIGAAIGTVSLASVTMTMAAKGIASAGLGIAMGIKTGIETEGPTLKRVLAGAATGAITAGSTFAGSLIDASSFGAAGNAFANYAATLMTGTPAEIVSVTTQRTINTGYSGSTGGYMPYGRGYRGGSNIAIAMAY